MERLIVQLIVQLSIALRCDLLLSEYFLQSLQLSLLFDCVVLQNGQFVPHLLLSKHVVLQAALEKFGCFATFIAYPPRISLLVQVGVRELLNVQQDVIGWLL